MTVAPAATVAAARVAAACNPIVSVSRTTLVSGQTVDIVVRGLHGHGKVIVFNGFYSVPVCARCQSR